MIFNDHILTSWAEAGGIIPFNKAHINPASIDLTWSGRFRYANDIHNWTDVKEVDTLLLQSDQVYMLDTAEVIHLPAALCGMYMLKSSLGRAGLQMTYSAWVDPGFTGTLTCQVWSNVPWRLQLERGQRLVQLVIMELVEPALQPYAGKYQGQNVPTPNR